MIILLALFIFIALYFIWLTFNSFYAFIKFYRSSLEIKYLVKSGTTLTEDLVKQMAFYYLIAVIVMGISWAFLMATLLGFVSVYGIYVFILGWLIHDGFKYYSTIKLGTFISEIGVHHGSETYVWSDIKHHRWLLKKRPKKDTDQLHLFLRKKWRLNPLTFEVFFHDHESVQEILDQFIKNTEKDYVD